MKFHEISFHVKFRYPQPMRSTPLIHTSTLIHTVDVTFHTL
jgi:hypothetical protein